jgi:uncharacterized protein DUF6602
MGQEIASRQSQNLTMLATHMAKVEATLLRAAQISAGAGHPLHKGTPREVFIQEFLSNHLSEDLAIGQGEIISADSQPGEIRNQFEIVLYKRHYPKLLFGGAVNAFLAESVVSTIDVKSKLTKKELRRAVKAARNIKALNRYFGPNRYTSLLQVISPAPLCYVVAYDGQARMETTREWLLALCTEEGIRLPELPPLVQQRYGIACPTIDGIFVLGKGFVQFDNLAPGFLPPDQRAKHPEMRYYIGKTGDGTLLTFFIFLTHVVAGLRAEIPDLFPYLQYFSVDVVP